VSSTHWSHNRLEETRWRGGIALARFFVLSRHISPCSLPWDRGKESLSAPLPSEPDGRVSRIRLSGQWFPAFAGRQARARASVSEINPCSTSTITIKHPAFMDDEKDMYAGIFAANTQSQVTRKLSIKGVEAVVWRISN